MHAETYTRWGTECPSCAPASKKSADIELCDGGDICDDDVCGGDVGNYGW